MFSKRIKSIKESPIREFAPIVEKVKSEGKKIYSLNIGQPDIVTPREYFDAIANIDEEILAYTHSQGIPELLEAMEDYYKSVGTDFEKDDIIITNGGSEAILFAYMALCDAGDEILAFEPYYTNYNIFAKEVDASIVPVTTYASENFRLPAKEDIVSKISDKTKVIAITNPSNPTGRVYTQEEIDLVCEIAQEYDLTILVDEVYREFVYDGEFVSFNSKKEVSDRVVMIDSLSKRFSACGTRIGCLVSKNKDFLAHVMKLCQARLCTPYIEQIGAAALLKKDKKFVDSCIEEYKRRRDTIYKGLNSIDGISMERPNGAFYLVVKLPVENAYDFSKWILESYSLGGETVLLCPASEFYASDDLGKDEVRIAYVLNEIDLLKSVKIIKEGLKEYKKIMESEEAEQLSAINS